MNIIRCAMFWQTKTSCRKRATCLNIQPQNPSLSLESITPGKHPPYVMNTLKEHKAALHLPQSRSHWGGKKKQQLWCKSKPWASTLQGIGTAHRETMLLQAREMMMSQVWLQNFQSTLEFAIIKPASHFWNNFHLYLDRGLWEGGCHGSSVHQYLPSTLLRPAHTWGTQRTAVAFVSKRQVFTNVCGHSWISSNFFKLLSFTSARDAKGCSLLMFHHICF